VEAQHWAAVTTGTPNFHHVSSWAAAREFFVTLPNNLFPATLSCIRSENLNLLGGELCDFLGCPFHMQTALPSRRGYNLFGV
jgi:hypothetical protein